MKFFSPLRIFALLAVPVSLIAQSSVIPSSTVLYEGSSDAATGGAAIMPVRISSMQDFRPFSRIAFGGGVSALGVQYMTAINLSRYANLRATGNMFTYTMNNFSTNGFNVNGQMKLASTGASLDIYPSPQHGWRISPGVLVNNRNRAGGKFTAQSGTSFSLDGYTYYPSAAAPVSGIVGINLHSKNPAFTLTTGWGNMIPRKGRHLSFPVEIGAAFTGTPVVNFALNSGQVCDASGQYCINVVTDPMVQSNLQAQVAKYQNDANAMKVFPILSFGAAYSFRIR